MSKDLHKNKKHASQLWDAIIFVFMLIVVGVSAVCFGYNRGLAVVRDEAIDKGYAKFSKTGYAWKSRRAIERSGE